MSKHDTRKTLQQHNLAPHKRFGQNFLVNPNTAASIVHCADISEDDTIIEVGVGLGALTRSLSAKAKEVIGIEIDSGLIRYHQEEKLLADNVTLIHNDILKIDFKDLRDKSSTPLIIVANLPYSISNPFIFKLIENRMLVDRVVVMLQKEVADRLMASPSTKEYGIPTVLLGACARVKKLMTLKPHEFHPQPKIDSVVIAIDFCSVTALDLNFPPFDFTLFQKLVRAAFAKRRKTLINNISSLNLFSSDRDKKESKNNALGVIEASGITPQARAETLTPLDFVNLSIESAKWLNRGKLS